MGWVVQSAFWAGGVTVAGGTGGLGTPAALALFGLSAAANIATENLVRSLFLPIFGQKQPTVSPQQPAVSRPGIDMSGTFKGMDPSKFSSRFKSHESFRAKPHEGVDDPQVVGTPMSFKQGGHVISAFRTSSRDGSAGGGYGQFVKVQLDDGKVLLMAHLSEIADWVRDGVRFEANEILAKTEGAIVTGKL